MFSTNYFKTPTGELFFFDPNLESIERAWNKALLAGAIPSVFEPPTAAGPWDKAPVIGHRPRGTILHDLATVEEVTEDYALLELELEALELRYADVGRLPPLTAVAA